MRTRIQLIESMRSLRNLPMMFQRGFYDTSINRSCVLLHDNQTTDPSALSKAPGIIKEIKQAFGHQKQVSFIRLNSRTGLAHALDTGAHVGHAGNGNRSGNGGGSDGVENMWADEIRASRAFFGDPTTRIREGKDAHTGVPSLYNHSQAFNAASPSSSPPRSSERKTGSGTSNANGNGNGNDNGSGNGNGKTVGGSGDVHGQCLSEKDVKALATFVDELLSKSIIPHMEHKLMTLNDQV